MCKWRNSTFGRGARAPFPNSEWPSGLMTKTKKCNTGSCGKVLNMKHSLTATCPQRPVLLTRRTVHTFTLISTSLQRPSKLFPTAKQLLDWWTVYTKPHIVIVNDDENWSIRRVVDVCFCLVSVLSIYFYCVTYLHKNVFHDKNAAPSYNGNLYNGDFFSVPKVAVMGSFHCNKVLYFFK